LRTETAGEAARCRPAELEAQTRRIRGRHSTGLSCTSALYRELEIYLAERGRTEVAAEVFASLGAWEAGAPGGGGGGGGVSAPVPACARPVPTEIYPCRACSCQEILRADTARQNEGGDPIALVHLASCQRRLGLCGGMVGELATTLEEQAALQAATLRTALARAHAAYLDAARTTADIDSELRRRRPGDSHPPPPPPPPQEAAVAGAVAAPPVREEAEAEPAPERKPEAAAAETTVAGAGTAEAAEAAEATIVNPTTAAAAAGGTAGAQEAARPELLRRRRAAMNREVQAQAQV
jgi:hypothetical protein